MPTRCRSHTCRISVELVRPQSAIDWIGDRAVGERTKSSGSYPSASASASAPSASASASAPSESLSPSSLSESLSTSSLSESVSETLSKRVFESAWAGLSSGEAGVFPFSAPRL
ncbi:hypothetical protein DMJ13_18950 [halophilic archaeon]|nr:hypothetical protein DMJ13_18950 [halophilic archaeon]